MKKLSLLAFSMLILISCESQNLNEESDQNAMIMKSDLEEAVAVESILYAACENGSILDPKDGLCKYNTENIQSANAVLIKIKKPPLPEPCDSGRNCSEAIDKSQFLNSFTIEKFITIKVIDKKGRLINEVKNIESTPIDGLPFAQTILFAKPLSSEGILFMEGFSESMGGKFSVEVDLERMREK